MNRDEEVYNQNHVLGLILTFYSYFDELLVSFFIYLIAKLKVKSLRVSLRSKYIGKRKFQVVNF